MAEHVGVAPYQICRHQSILELPPASWDQMTGGNFYLSHTWLSIVETDSSCPPVYLVARTAQGELAAGLPLYMLPRPPTNRLSDLAEIFAPRSGETADWYPATLGGARIGYANNLLVDPELPPAEQAYLCRLLLSAMATETPDRCTRTSALLYLTECGARQMAADSSWLLAFSSAEAVLDIQWSSLEEYAAALGPSQRRTVRADLRAFERSGLTTTTVFLRDVVSETAPLAVNVQHKYGHDSTVDRQLRFFGTCADCLGDSAIVLGCRDGSRLVGYSFNIVWGNTLYVRSAGFDYTAAPRQGEHFVIMYYQPIQYAIDAGLRRIHFGTQSFATKVRRGCRLAPLWSAIRNDPPVTEAVRNAVAENSRRRLRQWDAELGPALGYLPSQRWIHPD